MHSGIVYRVVGDEGALSVLAWERKVWRSFGCCREQFWVEKKSDILKYLELRVANNHALRD